MPQGRARRTAVVALVVLSSLSFLIALPGVWASRNLLDTDRFVSRAGPLIEQPTIQVALTDRLTDELMLLVDAEQRARDALPERAGSLAGPLADAAEARVREAVRSALASERVERLWVGALRTAHERAVRVLRGDSDVVRTDGDAVTLDLVPVANAVLQRIASTSPQLLGRQVDLPELTVDDLPPQAIARIESATGTELPDDFAQLTVHDRGALRAAQDALLWFERIVVVVVPLALVLAGAALWLSQRRRRTLLQLCAGVALGMALLSAATAVLRGEVASLPPTEQGRAAAAQAVAAFTDPLLAVAAATVAGAVAVALVTVVLGRSTRTRRRRRGDPVSEVAR